MKKSAYSELYLSCAQTNTAWAFEYGVRALKFSLSQFVQKWISFEHIKLLETGDPHFLAGVSGVELALLVAGADGADFLEMDFSPSQNYWTGFVACLYQWSRNVSYKEIFSAVSAKDFICMYPTFHQEDIENVLQEIDRRMKK